MAAFLHHDARTGRGGLREGARLRRIEYPRLAGDQRERHAGQARAGHGLRGPLPQGQDPRDDLQHLRSPHWRGLHARPAQYRPQGRGLSEADGPRRDRLFRPGVRVLHFRRHPLRPERARGLLPHRLGRGQVEHRARRDAGQSGLQDQAEGRLFPRPAQRFPAGRPQRHDADARVHRRANRGAAPRGRDRRPGRDRHALQYPADHGRQRPEVQVRRQEHG